MQTKLEEGCHVRVVDYSGHFMASGVYVRSYEVNGVAFCFVKPAKDSPHCEQYGVEAYRVQRLPESAFDRDLSNLGNHVGHGVKTMEKQVTAAQRLRWLCAELMGGNSFSRESLERWFLDADREIHQQNREADRRADKESRR